MCLTVGIKLPGCEILPLSVTVNYVSGKVGEGDTAELVMRRVPADADETSSSPQVY